MNSVIIIFVAISYVFIFFGFLKFKEKKEDEIDGLNLGIELFEYRIKVRDRTIKDLNAKVEILEKSLQKEYKFVDEIVAEYNKFVAVINATYDQNIPFANKAKFNKDLN